MRDEWRDIPGWEGLYQVSSVGAVRTFDRVVKQANRWGGVTERALRGKVLANAVDATGYHVVTLYRDAKPLTARVHRLVCLAFHGPAPETRPHVAHGNGVRNDNRAGNLRWASPAENSADMVLHGTAPRGQSNARNRISREQAERIASEKSKMTCATAAKAHGVSETTVREIWTGCHWSSP